MKRTEIFTDGGCSPNPGLGGWGVVVVDQKQVVAEYSGCEAETSNNRMELTAAIKALENVDGPVRIVTDSQYVKMGITEWMRGWKAKGWKTASRKPVKNQDLWKLLDELRQGRDVEWGWVRGHTGDKFNERADELVGLARESA